MKRYVVGGVMAMTAAAAHAQSSVAFYGVVDIGVTYLNSAQTGKAGVHLKGSTQVAVSDAHTTELSGSRWGLRGAEDLGGELQTTFALENGYVANNGTFAQGGAGFGRQAYVGLISANAGTASAGRQYDLMIDSVQQFSAPYWAGYMSTHVNDVDNLSNTNLINSSIKYTTPVFHSVRADALYRFGGITENPTRNQIWSLGASFNGGAISMGIGYLNARNPNVSFYGNTPNKGLATADNLGSPGSASTPQSSPAFAG